MYFGKTSVSRLEQTRLTTTNLSKPPTNSKTAKRLGVRQQNNGREKEAQKDSDWPGFAGISELSFATHRQPSTRSHWAKNKHTQSHSCVTAYETHTLTDSYPFIQLHTHTTLLKARDTHAVSLLCYSTRNTHMQEKCWDVWFFN